MPVTEPIVTIELERWAFIAGATATQVATVAMRLRRMMRSSSLASSAEANIVGPIATPGKPTEPPALETTTSIRPHRSSMVCPSSR